MNSSGLKNLQNVTNYFSIKYLEYNKSLVMDFPHINPDCGKNKREQHLISLSSTKNLKF